MYADDLADAIIAAVKNISNVPDVLNIGVGTDHSILEYYNIVKDVLGWKGQFEFDRERPTGMMRKVVDTTLQTRWGWAPKTPLREGIARTYRYFLEDSGR
jgi:GDP-L-fucose synthase